ncbi:hypothetical protein [Sorangium sp. So ce513]|uniref:hypothetical protein n=1 Tax=Sorangium sp. So ce513 TaxID=3133315 RepID=UPI003F61AE6B
MATKPKQYSVRDERAMELLDLALGEFMRDGRVSSVWCDVCGGLIEVEAIGDSAYSVSCACGRFRDTLRGI